MDSKDPVQIMEIFNSILCRAFAAYRPAAIVSGMKADCLMYSEKEPEFFPVAARAKGKKIGYEKYKYKKHSKAGKKQKDSHKNRPLIKYFSQGGFMQEYRI